MLLSRALVALALVACKGSDDKGGEETGGPAPAPCDVSALDASWPEDGLSPASRAPILSVSFSGVASEEGTLFSVTDESGAEVEGTTTLSDGVATWEPSALLDADTTYAWTATVCDATGGGAFTTGAHGERVDTSALGDTSYALDLDSATWVEPEGGESIFRGLFSEVLLLGVQSADDSSLDLIAAIGEVLEDDGTIQQSPCYSTADFDPADFRNNPYASVGPTTLSLEIEGFTVPVENVYVSGAFDGQGGLADGVMEAEVDARTMADALGLRDSQVCDLLETYVGISCTACSTDGETYCVGMRLEDLTGEIVDGLRVVPNEDPQECDESDDDER